MNAPERRRRRPAVSCTLCRRRKIRCNRESPCSNCLRSRTVECVYNNYPSPPLPESASDAPAFEPRAASAQELLEQSHQSSTHRTASTNRSSTVPSRHPASLMAASTAVSTPASTASGNEVESMRKRILLLEDQLSSQAAARSMPPSTVAHNSNIETTTSGLAGTIHVLRGSQALGQPRAVTRNVMHKTRLFGQSHWITGFVQFRHVLDMIEPYVRESSKAYLGLMRCKKLGSIIKAQREPQWPPATTELPAKEVTDELIDCYLRTSERVHRILHIPTFRKDYEALCSSDSVPDRVFLIQLKLVLAIGATVYDSRYSLRASAIQWVYEAQHWLLQPEFKSRLTMQNLQTDLLLLLAREATGMGDDLTWIPAGALLRTAVYMGLHRDPKYLSTRTAFAAEMRRRLWNTILEVNLQASMTSGGAPMVNLSDFDTEPPSNLDDDQLMDEDPAPKPRDVFTQSSVAIGLRQTFPIRLAVAKFLNDLGSRGTYEEAIRLDDELRSECKDLRLSIQACNLAHGSLSSQFEMRIVDFIMNRYLMALHMPFFNLALHEPVYAHSRMMVVETALRAWCTAYPSSAINIAQSRYSTPSQDTEDISRLVTCGSGPLRTVAFQACLSIVMELRAQLQKNEGLGPMPLRTDLLSVLDDGKRWALESIEAGETNVKGYLVMSLFTVEVENLMKGASEEEIVVSLLGGIEETEATCMSILERQAGQLQSGEMSDWAGQAPLGSPSDIMDDWLFMLPDPSTNFPGEDLSSGLPNSRVGVGLIPLVNV